MSIYIQQSSVLSKFNSESNWTILNPIEQSIKTKIDTKGIPLKSWDVNIYRGIITGYNAAFIIDGKKKDELIAKDAKSAEIIRPILRGKDIKRYEFNFANSWLINTHNGIKEKNILPVDVNNYPAIKDHLDCFYETLVKRQDKGDTPYNLRNCAYMDEFNKQIIVWQRITQSNIFCLTEPGIVALDSMAFISANEKSRYLLAFLNSTVMNFWIKKNVPQYGDSGYRLSNQFVELFPVPNDYQLYPSIDTAVEKQLNGKDNINLIEELVMNAYGLTKEEQEYLINKRYL